MAHISALAKEAKGFQDLCNWRNGVGNRPQTFLCMPEQSRTPEIATLPPTPPKTTHTNWGPRWKTHQIRSLRKPKNTSGGKLRWWLGPLISGRFSVCVCEHVWVIAVRLQMEDRHHARFPFPIPLFCSNYLSGLSTSCFLFFI